MVYVNNEIITQYNYPLKKGQIVQVAKNRHKHSMTNKMVRIVYEDAFLMVVEKKEGILTNVQPGMRQENVKAVLDEYVQRQSRSFAVHTIHRLDKGTSGLLIFAKRRDIQKMFSDNWKDLVTDRRYVAVVQGEMEKDSGTVSSWLTDNKMFVTYSSPYDNGGKFAVTHYRTLKRNIDSQYYYRLAQTPKSQRQEVIDEMCRLTADYENEKSTFVKNPMLVEFLGLKHREAFTESKLEQAILDHLEHFLMEMGKGYALVDRQMHIHTEDNDYYIDLVFYNYLLKCFVLVDLKTTKVSYEDVGQMDMYLKLFDTYKRPEGDNPAIGIILCSETNADVARFSTLATNKQMYASKYLTYMPSKEVLAREIEQQKEIFRLQNNGEEEK
jgi:predicted nuclease of restriction endonuclease-like (RecB) superfamily